MRSISRPACSRLWPLLPLPASQAARTRSPTASSTSCLPGKRRRSGPSPRWSTSSGERQVDPLLQADLVFQQLQQVHGVTVVPVNRVVEVYVRPADRPGASPEQAAIVCDLLGCDGADRADRDHLRHLQPAQVRRRPCNCSVRPGARPRGRRTSTRASWPGRRRRSRPIRCPPSEAAIDPGRRHVRRGQRHGARAPAPATPPAGTTRSGRWATRNTS